MTVLATAGLAAIVFGDASVAAAVAGIFSVLNLLLNARLSRKLDRHRDELAQPRHIVYDEETGRASASVIPVRADDPHPPPHPPRRSTDTP